MVAGGANGVSMDLSSEVIVTGDLDPSDLNLGGLSGDDGSTATLLARVEDGLFADHCIPRAEVEVLELASA